MPRLERRTPANKELGIKPDEVPMLFILALFSQVAFLVFPQLRQTLYRIGLLWIFSYFFTYFSPYFSSSALFLFSSSVGGHFSTHFPHFPHFPYTLGVVGRETLTSGSIYLRTVVSWPPGVNKNGPPDGQGCVPNGHKPKVSRVNKPAAKVDASGIRSTWNPLR